MVHYLQKCSPFSSPHTSGITHWVHLCVSTILERDRSIVHRALRIKVKLKLKKRRASEVELRY